MNPAPGIEGVHLHVVVHLRGGRACVRLRYTACTACTARAFDAEVAVEIPRGAHVVREREARAPGWGGACIVEVAHEHEHAAF